MFFLEKISDLLTTTQDNRLKSHICSKCAGLLCVKFALLNLPDAAFHGKWNLLCRSHGALRLAVSLLNRRQSGRLSQTSRLREKVEETGLLDCPNVIADRLVVQFKMFGDVAVAHTLFVQFPNEGDFCFGVHSYRFSQGRIEKFLDTDVSEIYGEYENTSPP